MVNWRDPEVEDFCQRAWAILVRAAGAHPGRARRHIVLYCLGSGGLLHVRMLFLPKADE